MPYFLLPNSLCGEIERTIASFWWQKAHENKGIHWCQWQHMCQPKDEGGMGFRSLAKFNVALLAKQGWRILTNPNSLVAQVLKAKYFPNENFLNSRLGNNCSFTWKSIWAAKGVLIDVGRGSEISALNDSWIPDFKNARLSSYVNNLCDFKVAELIDESSKKWKEELIGSTFPEDVAAKILRIPLAKKADDDILAWSGEPSGEFTGERNKRVHEKISRSGKEITNFIKSYILELKGIEEKLPKDLTEVKRWQHPPDQTVKINFDAAYDGKICQAAVGIVARNREGSVLLSFSMIYPQVESVFAAEAIACRTATQLGIDMQWSKLIIEGDALTIAKIKSCRFEYIPRVANKLAHTIATETMKGKGEIYLIGSIPAYVEHLKESKKEGAPE
ncbi:reverse transcriptase [Gossypium australe]|uniref:Reverse transcriptase n=1 Tax=Gossypium australe TaxID=47621 RepID=A0A5B6X2Y9_9ROSI|nr:reverse transcriptase [Gossypium australe]